MNVNCPTCEKEVQWGEMSPYRPFCSKKCQLIDLGEWANEEKAIAVKQPDQDSIQDIDIEDIEALLSKQGDDFFKPS